MALAVIDEEVEKKLRGILHDGVGFASQKSAIQAILIVFPVMERQPRAAHRPYAAIGVIYGCGIAPGIEIVMKGETAGAIHHFGCAPATLDIRFDQVEERLSSFREVADFGRPVVHLEIDVGGVFTVPRRSHTFVPNALQVGRHGAGTTAPHQQIPAELEVECGEARIILAGLDTCQTLIYRESLD